MLYIQSTHETGYNVVLCELFDYISHNIRHECELHIAITYLRSDVSLGSLWKFYNPTDLPDMWNTTVSIMMQTPIFFTIYDNRGANLSYTKFEIHFRRTDVNSL